MVKSERLDALFGALSDPTRRAIVNRLGSGEAAVGELAKPFNMSLPAVSKHLRVLEEAGLIERTREGRNQYCRLRGEPMREAADWMAKYRAFWNGKGAARPAKKKAAGKKKTAKGPNGAKPARKRRAGR